MNSEQVKTACGKDWNTLAANIKKMGLNTYDFKGTFCSSDNEKNLPNPLTNQNTIADRLSSLATHLLVVQLFALSDERAYQEFLCHTANFNPGGIPSVGLVKDLFYDGVRNHCKGLGITVDS
jgi:hypothetical protein